MLHALGVSRVALLSNNPDKARQLRSCGVTVVAQVPTGVHVSAANVALPGDEGAPGRAHARPPAAGVNEVACSRGSRGGTRVAGGRRNGRSKSDAKSHANAIVSGNTMRDQDEEGSGAVVVPRAHDPL